MPYTGPSSADWRKTAISSPVHAALNIRMSTHALVLSACSLSLSCSLALSLSLSRSLSLSLCLSLALARSLSFCVCVCAVLQCLRLTSD